MSYHHVFPDSDGWCRAARLSEGPRLPDGALVTREACLAVMDCPGMFHYRGDRLCCPQDDRRAWRELLASYPREEAESRLQIFRDRRPAVLADLPADVPVRPRRPRIGIPFPGLPWQTPVPGLIVRELQLDDLDLLSAETVALGWEPAWCPETAKPCCQPPEAHTWMKFAQRIDRPTAWQFLVEWRGKPIQFELMEQGPPPVSVATYHVMRERPHWFWREAWRPIAQGLQQLGHVTCRGLIRGNLDYWVDSLKHHYAGRVIGPRPSGGTILEYDLAQIPFIGWPARRTAGPNWQWQTGRAMVREATEADVAGLPSELERLWGTGHPALPLRLRMLDEHWNLDRGSIILGYVDGTLTDVRLYRMRQPTLVNATLLSNLRDPETDEGHRLVRWGLLQWAVDAGYTEMSSFIQDEVFNHPIVQNCYAFESARVFVRHTNYKTKMVQIRIPNLRQAIATITASQGRWRPEAARPGLAESFPEGVVLP